MAPSSLQHLVNQANFCGERWSDTQPASDSWIRTHRPQSYMVQGGLLSVELPLTSQTMLNLADQTTCWKVREYTSDWSLHNNAGVFSVLGGGAEAYLQHRMLVTDVTSEGPAAEYLGSEVVFRKSGTLQQDEVDVLLRAESAFRSRHQPATLRNAIVSRDWSTVQSIVVDACALISSNSGQSAQVELLALRLWALGVVAWLR
jgi:hypothetical protein